MNEARDSAGVIAPPPLIALAAVVLGLALDWLLPAYLLDRAAELAGAHRRRCPAFRRWRGLGIPASSPSARPAPMSKPWKPAIGAGDRRHFRRLRNPMYVGLALLLVGLAMLLALRLDAGDDVVFVPVFISAW